MTLVIAALGTLLGLLLWGVGCAVAYRFTPLIILPPVGAFIGLLILMGLSALMRSLL